VLVRHFLLRTGNKYHQNIQLATDQVRALCWPHPTGIVLATSILHSNPQFEYHLPLY